MPFRFVVCFIKYSRQYPRMQPMKYSLHYQSNVNRIVFYLDDHFVECEGAGFV